MVDSIFSPDGKFMWTGSEWIPSPPKEGNREPLPSASQSGDIRDSVVMGDVNRQITQNITYQSEPISAETLASAIAKAMSESVNQTENMATESGIVVVNGTKMIEPGVILVEMLYGESCVFGTGTVIRDSVLLDSVSIKGYSRISDSVLNDYAEVDFETNIHESVIGKNAKIGNGCRIVRCEVQDGVVIPPNTHIEGAILS